MKIEQNSVEQLKELLSGRKRITVVSHVNPDGDAIGAGLAWSHLLGSMGHEVEFMLPNSWPGFLGFIPGIEAVKIFRPESAREYGEFIAGSDIIFFLDLNRPDRMEDLGRAISENRSAKRVLIDHHLDPPAMFDLAISHTEASSTSFLIYKVAEAMGMEKRIELAQAEALYVGISTDTGNFSFGNLTPELYRTVARLVEKGVDAVRLNNAIYNNYSFERTQLMGYLLSKKMKRVKEHEYAAYICMSNKEMNRHRFRQGDNEGFVNIPLSVKGMTVSAFFMETKEGVKVSLRSKGRVDVDAMAKKYFKGGGHKNAAGGKVYGTLRQAVNLYQKALDAGSGISDNSK